jgi:hypothetical protein
VATHGSIGAGNETPRRGRLWLSTLIIASVFFRKSGKGQIKRQGQVRPGHTGRYGSNCLPAGKAQDASDSENHGAKAHGAMCHPDPSAKADGNENGLLAVSHWHKLKGFIHVCQRLKACHKRQRMLLLTVDNFIKANKLNMKQKVKAPDFSEAFVLLFIY